MEFILHFVSDIRNWSAFCFV